MDLPSHQHHHHGTGNPWRKCTLCRSHSQSLSVLQKASQRAVKWPEVKPSVQTPKDDPVVYTSIDDAFSSIIQYMNTTSRQCKRYYRSHSDGNKLEADRVHCCRYHTPHFSKVQRSNPLQSAEDVHVVVQPGTYAVSAGEWGTARQQTHVVHVQSGQTVDLDFCL